MLNNKRTIPATVEKKKNSKDKEIIKGKLQ